MHVQHADGSSKLTMFNDADQMQKHLAIHTEKMMSQAQAKLDALGNPRAMAFAMKDEAEKEILKVSALVPGAEISMKKGDPIERPDGTTDTAPRTGRYQVSASGQLIPLL